jgi:hypothetical protein
MIYFLYILILFIQGNIGALYEIKSTPETILEN